MNWLLINPDCGWMYRGTPFAKPGNHSAVPLGLLCVAAELRKNGNKVTILDYNAGDMWITSCYPDKVGITGTTPNAKRIYSIIDFIKRNIADFGIYIGGSHASAIPKEVEGETGATVCPGEFEKYDHLNDLEFPAYDLIDPNKYNMSRFLCRKNPVAYLETSRGCYGKCTFCDKAVQGRKMRFKSPERVVAEMEYVLSLGYEEIQIVDDMFTADPARVEEICTLILKKGLKFPWYPRSGVRTDRSSLWLYRLMKRAGCYRLPFGIESGSQPVLDRIKKEITIEQIERSVRFAKQAGLETEAFFMVALPGETEDDLRKTLELALRLKPDYLKAPQVTLPMPGTELAASMADQIKSKDWSLYHYMGDYRQIYDHDVLSWETIDNFRKLFIKKVLKRPGRLIKAGARALMTGKYKALLWA